MTVQAGIFWAVPEKEKGGWGFYVIKKAYPVSYANASGFIDYPFSHYEKWDDVKSGGETDDCYRYPRGRVIYDANNKRHRVFADECLNEYDLQEIIELFEITDFELCRDEHYASAFSKKKACQHIEPTLTYDILRGKDKIGENLIEISYGETRILVELGKALDGGEELSETEKHVLETPYRAVVVSHYHADHAGLIVYKRDCPVYIGRGEKFVMIVRPSMITYLEKLYRAMYLPGATLVYSMWSGYKENGDTAEFLNRATDMFMDIVDIHTSGHADIKAIEALRQRVDPDELIQVHKPQENRV